MSDIGGYAWQGVAGMGMNDKAKEMKDKAAQAAKDAMGKDENVDNIAGKAKAATDNKHDEQIDKVAEKAKQNNDQM
jgi:hypothetical protein